MIPKINTFLLIDGISFITHFYIVVNKKFDEMQSYLDATYNELSMIHYDNEISLEEHVNNDNHNGDTLEESMTQFLNLIKELKKLDNEGNQ